VAEQAQQASLFGAFSLKYLVEIVFRRKRIVAYAMLLVTVLSIGGSYIIPPAYISTTTILLHHEKILNPLVRYETAVSLTDHQRLNTFQKIIYSRPLIEEVMREVGLFREDMSPMDVESTVDRLRQNVHIMQLSGESFSIAVTWSEPHAAKQLVEAVTGMFIHRSLEGNRREASAAVEFIEAQLNHYKARLDDSTDVLKTFKEDNFEALPGQQKDNLGRYNRYKADLLELNIEIRELELQIELNQSRLSGEKEMVVEQTVFVEETAYQRQFKDLNMELAKLLSTHRENHPRVVNLRKEIAALEVLMEEDRKQDKASETRKVRSPIYLQLRARIEESTVKLEAAKAKQVELQRMVDDLKQMVGEAPQMERKLTDLESEVAINRQIYENLKVKLEHAKVTREVELAQQRNRFKIIEPALVPLSRYKPIRKQMAIGGILGGLVLGLVLTFCLELIDPAIIRREELARKYGRPVLARIPKVFHAANGRLSRAAALLSGSRIMRVARSLIGVQRFTMAPTFSPSLLLSGEDLAAAGRSRDKGFDPLRGLVEAYRQIHKELLAGREEDGDGLALGITSPNHGEGRTLLAANLTLVVASDLDLRVLVVDCDLRSRGLSKLLDFETAPGLTEHLDGGPLEIRPSGIRRLSVLAAGTSEVNQVEALASPDFAALVVRLKREFDVVVFDLPPANPYADAQLVVKQLDGALVTVRTYLTRKVHLGETVNRVGLGRVRGFLMNYLEYWIPPWLYRWL